MRVIFGPGTLANIAQEVEALGARRALVLCTQGQRSQAEIVASLLGPLCAYIFDRAVMHVPAEIAKQALCIARQFSVDCLVVIGGGSTVGLGKAIALESALPIVAVPSTYSGSEMTPLYGITEFGEKRIGRDARVLPKTVLYDPNLSSNLPLTITVVSGFNAIAHAAEGLYAHDGNPVASMFAEEGIRALVDGLLHLKLDLSNANARTACLYGSWLCGMVLGQVGMALNHKLAHILGGSFNLPHAETHTVLLPHVLAYNSEAAESAMHRIARALNSTTAPSGVFDLALGLGAPTALRDIGLEEKYLDRACDLVLDKPFWNPKPVEKKGIRQLLQQAWEGQRPC